MNPPSLSVAIVSLERTYSADATWWSARLLDTIAGSGACATEHEEGIDITDDTAARVTELLHAVVPDLHLVGTLRDHDVTSVLVAGRGQRAVLVRADTDGANVTAWAADQSTAELLCGRVRAALPRTKARADHVPLSFWHFDDGADVDIRDVPCPTLDEIAPNYVARVRGQLERLSALERPDSLGKMILWYGPPGTGKTHAVRALARAWATRLGASVEIVIDPEVLFASSSYLHSLFLSDHRPQRSARAARRRLGHDAPETANDEVPPRLIVLEDAAELFTTGCRETQGFARLLNLTDGVLGQGRRLVFLLTTNQEIGRIDPALIRPGRCIQALEFEPFDVLQANAWLASHGHPHLAGSVDGDRTLAELYGMTTRTLTPPVSCVESRLGFTASARAG
jgi:hypothetical protein